MNMMQRQTAIEATPASATRYDNVTIALHWAMAGLVVAQFLLAEFWGFFPRPEHHLMIVTHMSLGLILTAVLALRFIWRAKFGRRLPPAGVGVLDRVAKVMHHTLYMLLVAEIPLGFLTRWTDNQALSFFGLLIPSPFGHFSRTTGWVVDQIHDYAAWTIIILAAIHAAAALFHHYLWKDGVLRRMLPLRV
ncbi:MAG TPA: cytochrome b/b6 domain-containing protein [Acidocella sp.]|nr:cytochrome b/b6 domain-containing protein [Acidocella sp.]